MLFFGPFFFSTSVGLLYLDFPPFWSSIEELRKIVKEKNKNQSEVQNISTEVENMTKEKDSEIENDLKKETHSEMESLNDEKNKLKTISLEKVSQSF